MNKRTTADSLREPSTTPSQRESLSNFANTSARTSLRRAIQRAEEIYKKEGKSKLIGYLKAKELTGYAGFVKTYETEECYEFNKSNTKLFHKDDYYKEREIYAHKIAFFKTEIKKDIVKVKEGQNSKFVFIDIQLSSESENSIIPIFGSGNHDNFETNDELSNLHFETIDLYNQFGIRESKYFRHIRYARHECYNVSFATHDIDRLFPYSTGTPTRRPQGAPPKFPQAVVNSLLDKQYQGTDSLPERSEIIKILGAYYAESAKEQPTEKTIRRKADTWLAQRKRSVPPSGHN